MNLNSITQVNLYGLEKEFNELMTLYKNKKLPNKILLSGNKGIGKCTLAYHLINFVLSQNEEFPYDKNNLLINKDNRSYKLTINNANPNLNLIDIAKDKKNIDISQIRNLILNLNKSSFNSKPRFVLIDNIEFLNKNSVNSLLKILEEPNDNIYFLLINNNKQVFSTLKSRCLDFKISISNLQSIKIINNILNQNVYDFVNKDLVNYYFTPGKIYKLIQFSRENKIELDKLNVKDFLKILIKQKLYNKNIFGRLILFDFIEIFLTKKEFFINKNLYHYFIKKIDDLIKFNLDDETLVNEFKEKVLNE